jgi:hypothetical protein
MPGSGLEIDGAMQQAAQPGRQENSGDVVASRTARSSGAG